MKTLTKEHHELKISYLRYRLERVPHGYIDQFRGKPAVYVYYDPDNPKTTLRSKARYYTDSPTGKIYVQRIQEYIELKSQYDYYVTKWNSTYVEPPRKIKFPLRSITPRRLKTELDREFFERAVPNQNLNESPVKMPYKGQIFHSKNEIAGVKAVESFGYDFKTEVLVDLARYNKNDLPCVIFPDLLFYVPEIDKVIIMEVDGALDSEGYAVKSYGTTIKLLLAGLVEGKDFIVIRMADGRVFHPEIFDDMITMAINASIKELDLEFED